MADKKLNEVTKVTDMAYVPVIMSDGSIGQIAKADLASVVAGLLPSAGFICQVYDQYVTASSPATIEVSSNKVTLLNANYTYKNESRTMLFATGQMNVLLDDKTYGLNFSFSDNKLTISTSSNGSYGVRIRVITF